MNTPTQLYSEKTELNILGAVMYTPKIVPDLSVMLHPSDMGLVKHEKIMDAMSWLYNTHGALDINLLCEVLSNRNELDLVGGVGYIQGLVNTVEDPYNWQQYADIVRNYAFRRRLQRASLEITSLVGDMTLPIQDLISNSEQAVFGATSEYVQQSTGPSAREMAMEWARNPKAIHGFTTGYPKLDMDFGGFGTSGFVGLLAHSGAGKSLMLQEWALNFLKIDQEELGHAPRGLIVPTETSKQFWQLRLIASALGTDTDTLRRGEYRELDKLDRVSAEIEALPLSFAEGSEPTGEMVISAVRQFNPDFVIVDGLSDMGGDENEFIRVSHNTISLHHIMHSMHKLVIASIQMNNDSKARKLKKPNSRDGRGSPSIIYQKVDRYLTLYRPAQLVESGEVDETELDAEHGPEYTELTVVKDRHTNSVGKKQILDMITIGGSHKFVVPAPKEQVNLMDF